MLLTRLDLMYVISNEGRHESITERWDALEDYFVCISECDLNDMTCATRCMVKHLRIENDSDIVVDLFSIKFLPSLKQDSSSVRSSNCFFIQ